MTFSPFYMGNHTKPWEPGDAGRMEPSSYTMGENWGAQINFMVPLDRESVRQCKRIAARQEEKMRLDYEMIRALKCAELQQKGFTIRPGSPLVHMCHDIIPISSLIQKEPPPEPVKKKRFGLF